MSDSSEKLSNLAMMAMGETVNHLKAEIELLRVENAKRAAYSENERDQLRTELSAAKALLGEVLPYVEYWVNETAKDTAKRIRAALGDEPASPSSYDQP